MQYIFVKKLSNSFIKLKKSYSSSIRDTSINNKMFYMRFFVKLCFVKSKSFYIFIISVV